MTKLQDQMLRSIERHAAAKVAYLQASDLLGDDPSMAETIDALDFLVVQDIALTKTAQLADVVLPAQAFTEREGSYTNAERRVQRFYPATSPSDEARADFAITAAIGEELGLELEAQYASLAFENLALVVPDYIDLNYSKLAETHEQWPIIGRDDVYYGGTTYDNSQGLGIQLVSAAEKGGSPSLSFEPPYELERSKGKLTAVPVTRLYDRGSSLKESSILANRLEISHIVLSPKDAQKRKLEMDSACLLSINDLQAELTVKIDNSVPHGFALLPRSLGIPMIAPTEIEVKAA